MSALQAQCSFQQSQDFIEMAATFIGLNKSLQLFLHNQSVTIVKTWDSMHEPHARRCSDRKFEPAAQISNVSYIYKK